MNTLGRYHEYMGGGDIMSTLGMSSSSRFAI